MPNSRKFAALMLAVFLNVGGCSPASTTLSKGMSMQEVVEAMHERGLEHQEMDMTDDYKAFSLPDGRVLILSGSNKVDGMELILNPEKPKVEREYTSVNSIEF